MLNEAIFCRFDWYVPTSIFLGIFLSYLAAAERIRELQRTHTRTISSQRTQMEESYQIAHPVSSGCSSSVG